MKKPQKWLQWVDIKTAEKIAEVRIYDKLFLHENPYDKSITDGWLSDINPDSLSRLNGSVVEREVRRWVEQAEKNEQVRMQFVRTGYFCLDSDSQSDKLIFNRIVGLKEDSGKS